MLHCWLGDVSHSMHAECIRRAFSPPSHYDPKHVPHDGEQLFHACVPGDVSPSYMQSSAMICLRPSIPQWPPTFTTSKGGSSSMRVGVGMSALAYMQSSVMEGLRPSIPLQPKICTTTRGVALPCKWGPGMSAIEYMQSSVMEGLRPSIPPQPKTFTTSQGSTFPFWFNASCV
jgi:hypothetical protein